MIKTCILPLILVMMPILNCSSSQQNSRSLENLWQPDQFIVSMHLTLGWAHIDETAVRASRQIQQDLLAQPYHTYENLIQFVRAARNGFRASINILNTTDIAWARIWAASISEEHRHVGTLQLAANLNKLEQLNQKLTLTYAFADKIENTAANSDPENYNKIKTLFDEIRPQLTLVSR